MKKNIFCLLAVFLSLSFIPMQSKAESASVSNTTASRNQSESVKADVLLKRLFAIREMDKSELNSSQKQDLRKEVRSIRDELKLMEGGIYLSVGAIIIIILLLILLL